MKLHLLSCPGPRPGPNLAYVFEVISEYLNGRRNPQVIYLSESVEQDQFASVTVDWFSECGRVLLAGLEEMPVAELEKVISDDAVFYVPGGRSYWLIHKMHETGYFDFIKERVHGGIPYVGFSAGAVVAGATIYSSTNRREEGLCVETLGFVPFGLNPHFPSKQAEREARIEALQEVSRVRGVPILGLDDDAHLVVNDSGTTVKNGCVLMIDNRNGQSMAQPVAVGNGCSAALHTHT